MLWLHVNFLFAHVMTACLEARGVAAQNSREKHGLSMRLGGIGIMVAFAEAEGVCTELEECLHRG